MPIKQEHKQALTCNNKVCHNKTVRKLDHAFYSQES